MNRDETLSLAQLMRRMLEEEPDMHEHLLEIRAREVLPEILGGLYKTIGRVDIREGVLYMQVHSAGVKHALTLERGKFIRRINDAVQAELIREIKLY